MEEVEWNFILLQRNQAGRTRKWSQKGTEDSEGDEGPIWEERKDVESNKDPIIRNQGRYVGCPLLVGQQKSIIQTNESLREKDFKT